MKTSKLLLVTTVIFGLLLGGLFVLQTRASTLQAEASCVPPRYALEDPTPESFKITLKLPRPYNHEDIDPSTLLVGGVVSMQTEEGWPKIKKNDFKFKVDGHQLVYWVILPEIWHMAPAPATWVDIEITVTGQLYDGTSFEGTFTLPVRTEDTDPPPPPP
jgi:hypothetical protein